MKLFFSEGRFLISEFSRPFAHKIWLLIENVSGRVVETTTYLSRRTFCGNFVPKYFVLLNHFSYLTNLLRPFCKKVSGRFVQTVFYLSKGNFLEGFSSQSISVKVFSDFEQKLFRRSAKVFRQGFQSCIQPVKSKFLKTFFRQLFFECFSDIEQKTFRLLEKTFRHRFQNCILCARRTKWQIKKKMKTSLFS